MKFLLQWLSIYPFLTLLWLVAFLPAKIQKILASTFAFLLYYLLPSRRKTAEKNIAIAFPDQSLQERNKLLQKSYKALGYSLVEMAIAWFWSVKKLDRMALLEGKEHIEKAQKKGHGAIILLPHYCNMEIIGTLLSIKIAIYVTFHVPQNSAFSRFIDKRRNRTIKKTISSKDLRSMIKVLKNNGLLWYSPDQSKYEKKAPYIRFFSKKVKTTTGTAKLAKLTGADVIPLAVQYDRQKHCYRLQFKPALPLEGKDILQDTRRVNQAIEELVYQNPQQYLWIHKRFKDYLSE